MPIADLSNRQRPPYVIFIKGTPAAFRNLEYKDPNTLYFISEKGAVKGSLYLGDKLITSGKDSIVSLNSLKDVLIDEGLVDKSILMFNGEFWVNKTLQEVFSEIGSFDSLNPGELGMIKAPTEEEKEKFLRGDGEWVEVQSVGKLTHSLTIGDKIFDGSENIVVDVYNGEMKEENVMKMVLSGSDNMTLL